MAFGTITQHCAFICYIVAGFMIQALASLVVRPQNTEAVIGSRASFICRTLDPYSINWEHWPVGSRVANDVFMSSTIIRPYDSRMEVHINRTMGEYRLIIRSVQSEDAGRYDCIDGAGHGERQGAELIVLGAPPTCTSRSNKDEIVGDNDCGVEAGSLEFRCILQYFGNLVPELQWRKTGGNLISPTTVKISQATNELTIVTVIKASLDMQGASYTCETKLSKYSWTSFDKIKVLYVFKTSSALTITAPGQMNCSANSSQPCNYTWFQDGIELPTLPNGSIYIDKPGKYRCVGECSITGLKCIVESSVVHFTTTDRSTFLRSYETPNILASVLTVIIALVAIFTIVMIKRRQYTHEQERSSCCSEILVTGRSSIQGIAPLNKCICIIYGKSDVVSVYTSKFPYKVIQEINKVGITDPRDIASCFVSKNLYISDAGCNCVWKINFKKRIADSVRNCVWKAKSVEQITKFITNISDPYTLSVTSRGQIVMASNPNIIMIYDCSNGRCQSQVQIYESTLDLKALKLLHAVQTTRGDFLVSHGSRYDKNPDVILVSSGGQIKQHYRKELESEHEQLIRPIHMAEDEKGSVYVADERSNRVLMLDKELNLILVIPFAGSSGRPTRLCFNNGRLIVGHDDGRVQFFGVAYLDRLKKSFETNGYRREASEYPEHASLIKQVI